MEPSPHPPRPPGPPGGASVLTDYEPPAEGDRVGLHVGLFVATFLSMVWCGGFLVGRGALWDPAWTPSEPGSLLTFVSVLTDWTFVTDGLLYAVPFLAFLTVHEFGHWTAARLLGTRVSLPYYIPVPIPLASLGTLGAVIQIKEPLRRTRQLFDIGAAGPLAGFVVALGVLVVGVLTLPPIDYLLGVGHVADVAYFEVHGELPPLSPVAVEGMALVFGDTPLFHAVGSLGWMRVPGHEVMHYPVLLAGWLGLFFTALNLLPVGQLDGGHVVYALFGPAVHRVVARVTTLLLALSGAIGFASGPEGLIPAWATWPVVAAGLALVASRVFAADWRLALGGAAVLAAVAAAVVEGLPGLAAEVGWTGWAVWVGLILFVIRIDHPPVQVVEPLTPGRKALGVLCLVIFVLCFSIQPIQVVQPPL